MHSVLKGPAGTDWQLIAPGDKGFSLLMHTVVVQNVPVVGQAFDTHGFELHCVGTGVIALLLHPDGVHWAVSQAVGLHTELMVFWSVISWYTQPLVGEHESTVQLLLSLQTVVNSWH